jgi:hypothetical protein
MTSPSDCSHKYLRLMSKMKESLSLAPIDFVGQSYPPRAGKRLNSAKMTIVTLISKYSKDFYFPNTDVIKLVSQQDVTINLVPNSVLLSFNPPQPT